jgi:NTP pyrophosphatase (non-canonical NTP hydrolase)
MYEERLAAAALWLASEAGEVAAEVRKAVTSAMGVDVPQDAAAARARLRDELGDVLWCVAEVATTAGLTLDECAVAQTKKQEHRYGDVIALHDTEGR